MGIFENIKYYFNERSKFWAANYPKAWSMGWLTQLCLAVIIYFLSFVVAIMIPVSRTDTPDVLTWYGLGFIPSFLWGIFIIYRLVKYNSEKLFGNRKLIHNFIEMPTYIIQLILPMGIPLILGFVLMFRVAVVEEDDQLANDKVAFEEAQPFFTFDYGTGNYYYQDFDNQYYDNYIHEIDYDFLNEMFLYFENDEAFYKYIITSKGGDEYINSQDLILRDSLNRYNQILKDSIVFHKGIFKDSRPKLYPYLFYHFSYGPNQAESKYFDNVFSLDPDSSKQYYFYKNYRDDAFVKDKLSRLLKEMKNFGFNTDPVFTANELMELFKLNVYYTDEETIINKKVAGFDHLVGQYKRQINYIQDCKNKDFFFAYDDQMYQVIFGVIFFLSLVLGLFKNMSWVEFLVGLFIAVLIPILTGISMAIMRFDKDSVYFTFWFIFVILFIWGIIEKQKGLRRKRGAFLLMIPHLCMAFFPVFILATLVDVYHLWDWSYFDRYLIHSPTKHNPNRMIYMDEYWNIREKSVGVMMVVGYLLYLFILYPLWIKMDWIKFMAKPKRS